MDEVKNILLQLYENKDISLGVHGTAINPLSNKPKVICEEGLMCRYNDLRRTIAFQDRGLIHAHGNITFERLIQYNYSTSKIGYTYETQMVDGRTQTQSKQIELEQCTFVFGIPSEQSTTDETLFSGKRRVFSKECRYSLDELRLGSEQYGRPIDPKYIIGYYLNGDLSTMEFNEKFYGFKDKNLNSTFIAELDLDKIAEENQVIKERNKQKEHIIEEQLAIDSERIIKTKPKGMIDRVKGVFDGIINKLKGGNTYDR